MMILKSKTIKVLALGLVIIGIGLPVAFASELKPIKFNDLPNRAQTFIKKHFVAESTELVLLENEILDKSYTVHLSKGTKIEFKGNGQWTDIETHGADIPAGILPQNLLDHVRQAHPNVKIIGIERKSRRFVVELQNDLELQYDLSGKFLRYDD